MKMRFPIHRAGLASAFLTASVCVPALAQSQPALPTGRQIPATQSIQSHGIGSMPMNVIVSPDGNYALTTGAGYREAICCVRLSDGVQKSRIDFEKKGISDATGLYYGLAFGTDGKLY
ncbi:MAG: hypothetical protein ACTHLZ_10095, partial [Tepidisphaeraceae bacterium]